MSLYSALFAGVSGLTAEASAIAAVSDNISNINTVGYKAVDTQFSTLVGEGRAGARYSAGGVNAISKSLISKAGLLQQSTSSTDIGVDGQGFFVTRTGSDPSSPVQLTRAGSFAPDKEGYLRNSAGLYLTGWRLDATGKYTNTGGTQNLEPVRLSDLTGTATPTTKISLRANLQNTTAAHGGAYTAGDIAKGTVTSAFPPRSFDVYDAQGGSHRVAIGAVKIGANEWKAEVYATPATDVAAAGGLLASGTIKFNPDGSLDLPNSSPALFGTITPAWTNAAGAQPIKLDFGTDKGVSGFSQFGATSFVTPSTDGGPLGNVSSVSISDGGKVSAVFENGSTRAVFQLPVATVANPDALTRTSGNAFTISDQSGNMSINAPGELGSGRISAFKLEASTADLAQEFTNLIRFQRAYSASSKIITTVDEMLQEVSNLKR